MPDTVLVANRGEIACRVIRAVQALGLRAAAVYSDADAELPHVALADTALRIGPAKPAESYLDGAAIIEAARHAGARLIHPGYGFLSENAAFAQAVSQAGFTFVGPSPEVMRAMGDKENARAAAAAAGVPVLPGSGKLDADDADRLLRLADAVGYPLLVKAAAGGGGIGMRLVHAEAELVAAVRTTSSMAANAFGDGAVYFERFVQTARHVEIQVFGLGNGSAVHLFERDCSLQRRHQKVIEESPAPGLPADARARMAEAAVKLAGSCAYQGAGTVEFLFDALTGAFYFLEMNTRIQVEHPVTEMVTGIDLVQAQIRLALGEPLAAALPQGSIRTQGHAVEARIYAEKPEKNFIPSPGLLTVLETPSMPDVRFESGYRAGNRVTPFYDPLLMKVIAQGVDREAAIDRLGEALAGIRVEGISTNLAYLLSVLDHPEYRAGRVHTRLLTAHHAELVAAAAGPVPDRLAQG